MAVPRSVGRYVSLLIHMYYPIQAAPSRINVAALLALMTAPEVEYSAATSGVAARTLVLDWGERRAQKEHTATRMRLRPGLRRWYMSSSSSSSSAAGRPSDGASLPGAAGWETSSWWCTRVGPGDVGSAPVRFDIDRRRLGPGNGPDAVLPASNAAGFFIVRVLPRPVRRRRAGELIP